MFKEFRSRQFRHCLNYFSLRFEVGLPVKSSTFPQAHHRLPYPRAASYNSASSGSVHVKMAVYVRLVEAHVKGTAAIQEDIEQVYSPDNATAFTYDDAQFYRQKAFERWSNFDWEIEKLAGDRYRVRAIRLAASECRRAAAVAATESRTGDLTLLPFDISDARPG